MAKAIKNTHHQLFDKIAAIIEAAHQKIASTVNLTMVYTYFEVGKMIVEQEQQGNKRAAYGKQTLLNLSQNLTQRFGKGFSVENLDRMRFFYNSYSTPISSTVLTISNSSSPMTNFKLSWSHYLLLMRIENTNERSFYEIECSKNNWSLTELKRQYKASLYERLALGKNKKEIALLSAQGQVIEKPADILKSPLTLDFLGIDTGINYSESDLENAIISKIQHFLLELGKGFLFEARQKRFSFDEKNFYVDLVFYNRLLQCYVLIDLKTDEIAHQDLGQMQMYVNYYNRFVKQPHEKSTIGILLCKQKNDALVELTLPDDANIYASAYSLYLPDKKMLQQKLAQWLVEFENEI